MARRPRQAPGQPVRLLLSEALSSVGVRVAEFRPTMVLSPRNPIRVWHIHWPDNLLRDDVGPGVRSGSAYSSAWYCSEAAPTNGRLDDPQHRPAQRSGFRLQKLLYSVVTRSVAATLTLSDAAAAQSRARWPILRQVPNASVGTGCIRCGRSTGSKRAGGCTTVGVSRSTCRSSSTSVGWTPTRASSDSGRCSGSPWPS